MVRTVPRMVIIKKKEVCWARGRAKGLLGVGPRLQSSRMRRLRQVRAKSSPRSRATLRPLWVPKCIELVAVVFPENGPTTFLYWVTFFYCLNLHTRAFGEASSLRSNKCLHRTMRHVAVHSVNELTLHCPLLFGVFTTL